MKAEYLVDVVFEHLTYTAARWVCSNNSREGGLGLDLDLAGSSSVKRSNNTGKPLQAGARSSSSARSSGGGGAAAAAGGHASPEWAAVRTAEQAGLLHGVQVCKDRWSRPVLLFRNPWKIENLHSDAPYLHMSPWAMPPSF
jgi:hypothetical protein